MRKPIVFSLLVLLVLGSVSCTRRASAESTAPPTQDPVAMTGFTEATVTAAFAMSETESAVRTQEAAPTETPVPVVVPTATEPSLVISDVDPSDPNYDTIMEVVSSGAVQLKQACGSSDVGEEGNLFCPQDGVLRSEMAMSICRAIYDLSELPGPTPSWADRSLRAELWYEDGQKTSTYYLVACLDQLYRDQYVSGSTTSALIFNPERLSRYEDYWVFFLEGVHGGTWEPPDATGLYKNCPVGVWFSGWCEAYINEDWYDLSKGPVQPDETINRVDLAKAIAQYLKNQTQ